MTVDVVIINTPVVVSIVQADGPVVTVQAPPIAAVSTTTVGMQGPPGPSGGATTVMAAEPLGGQRVVTSTGFHAGPADVNNIAGVTKAAGATGTAVEIVRAGLMTEPSWNWTPNTPVFVANTGVLTQTPVLTGPMRRIGWAVAATILNIDLMQPIIQV